jgi:hypothetical protein
VDATANRLRAKSVHPAFAFLLSAPVPLFLGGLITVINYGHTPEPQWANFAAWLIAAAMVFTGLSLLWSSITLIVGRRRSGWPLLCFFLLLAAFGVGLIDSFQHAKDAWAIMPAAPILSATVTVVAALACATGLSSLPMRQAE